MGCSSLPETNLTGWDSKRMNAELQLEVVWSKEQLDFPVRLDRNPYALSGRDQ